jgi:hypothetical protein
MRAEKRTNTFFHLVGIDRRDGGLLESPATWRQTHNVGFRLWDPDRRCQPPE